MHPNSSAKIFKNRRKRQVMPSCVKCVLSSALFIPPLPSCALASLFNVSPSPSLLSHPLAAEESLSVHHRLIAPGASMLIKRKDNIPAKNRSVRKVNHISDRRFMIFPDLYISLPYSQFLGWLWMFSETSDCLRAESMKSRSNLMHYIRSDRSTAGKWTQ